MKFDWGVSPKAVLAECMAATLFVFIGVEGSVLGCEWDPWTAAEVAAVAAASTGIDQRM